MRTWNRAGIFLAAAAAAAAACGEDILRPEGLTGDGVVWAVVGWSQAQADYPIRVDYRPVDAAVTDSAAFFFVLPSRLYRESGGRLLPAGAADLEPGRRHVRVWIEPDRSALQKATAAVILR